MIQTEPSPNPAYIAEPMRTIFVTILNILPTGQTVLLANLTSGEGLALYPMQLAGSGVLIALITAIGLEIFKRKDLK